MLTISSVAVSPLPPQMPTVVRVQPTPTVKASDNVSADNQGGATPLAPADVSLRAQGVVAPSSLPPVHPTGETPRVNPFNNNATPERLGDVTGVSAARAQWPTASLAINGARNERSAQSGVNALTPEDASDATRLNADAAASSAAQVRSESPRFRGELPPEVKNPVMEAMEAQINDLLPNMWSASRAAVDVLIGEEARAASVARSEILAGRLTSHAERVNEAAENYNRTSNLPEPPVAGRTIDRLV